MEKGNVSSTYINKQRKYCIFSDIPVKSVKAKIAGELKNRFDEGCFICFFEKTKELRIWTYDELRSIIGT